MKLYRSISISNEKEYLKVLNEIKANDFVFLSLHIAEEIDVNYIQNCKKVCSLFKNKKVRIIADISYKTLKIFDEKDFIVLAKKLGIYALRVDYGLDIKEIINIAKKMPVVINASTMERNDIKKISKVNKNILAMHNYYPREETGLDLNQFMNKSLMIKEFGIKLFAFISGDENLRGPIYQGLPTLEHQRFYSPHVSYIQLDKLNILDGIFIGDLGISKKEFELIDEYRKNNIIPLFVDKIEKKYINKIFTVREDSPSNLIRIKESREYASVGEKIKPFNCVKRKEGSITIDNLNYLRYSGELMICKVPFPSSKKVNVIGNVKKLSMPLLKCLDNKDKFIFLN